MSGAPDEKTVRTTKDEIWPEAWAAYAACAWALAFAVVHLYWALGGAVGLPPGMSVGMNRALFVIDIVAVPCASPATCPCSNGGASSSTSLGSLLEGSSTVRRLGATAEGRGVRGRSGEGSGRFAVPERG
jgi:hypothetical protein